ncbi:MAG: ribonuclease III domain-containing protein [Anaerovoracaceae bacterium]
MNELKVKQINTTALAYIGDGVYEVAIRKYLLKDNHANVDMLHRYTVAFVRAEAQALVIKGLMSQLTDEETSLVRRARNRKIMSKPRNVSPVIYKLATAFEALVGYLYLTKQEDRLEWIIDQSVMLINSSGVENVKREKNQK